MVRGSLANCCSQHCELHVTIIHESRHGQAVLCARSPIRLLHDPQRGIHRHITISFCLLVYASTDRAVILLWQLCLIFRDVRASYHLPGSAFTKLQCQCQIVHSCHVQVWAADSPPCAWACRQNSHVGRVRLAGDLPLPILGSNLGVLA